MAWSDSNMDIKSHVGSIGTNSKMNSLDLNVISWFRKQPKFDLRYWDSENKPDSKSGSLTLTLEQMKALKSLLNGVDLDSDDGMLFTIGTELSSNGELSAVRELVKSQNSVEEDTARPW